MTATAGRMPKITKGEGDVTPKDLDSARKLIGAIRSISKDPMVYFDKVRKVDIVAALSALSWYLDQLPRDYGYNCLTAAANMAKSTKVKDLGAVAEAIRDGSKLVKYADGPLLGDESVHTSSQWRPPIKGRDAAYSGPNVSMIPSPMEGNNVRDVEDLENDRGGGCEEEEEKKDEEAESVLTPPGGQITSAQVRERSDGNGNDGSIATASNNAGSDTTDGKVSDPSSCSASSLAAPIRNAHDPHKRVKGEVAGDGVVDTGANDSGVARGGGVEGVEVLSVDEGSPAAQRGLAAGDVITAVNRRPVQSLADLNELSQTRVLFLTIRRGDRELWLQLR